MKIEYHSIGIVRSPFRDKVGTPVQPSRARGIQGTVEVFPEFSEGLVDLEGFSHIILLCHLHQSNGYRLKVVPFLDTTPHGVFATRAPCRPNPIGLSVVRLLGIDGNTLLIEDIDLLDGSPVLDIKPYVDEFDKKTGVRSGWFETASSKVEVADDRFSNQSEE